MCTTLDGLMCSPMLFQLVNMFSQYFFVAIASELWCLLRIFFSVDYLNVDICFEFILVDYLIVVVCFVCFFG